MNPYNYKQYIALLFSSSSILLTACSASTPEKDLGGVAWSDSWIRVGTIMGVETPESFTLLDNKEALAADGLFYASWTDGDSRPYVNSDDETVNLYDAQLYLLVSECDSSEQAQINCDNWQSAARENYLVYNQETKAMAGQSYTLLFYHCNPDSSPYDHGVSAFAVIGENAVCAELTCLDTYSEDLNDLLKTFLEGCHYAAS